MWFQILHKKILDKFQVQVVSGISYADISVNTKAGLEGGEPPDRQRKRMV
jgi:hypothetical protein